MAFDLCRFAQNCRKILGAGMNYKTVIKEKGLKEPQEPLIFLKPSSSLIVEGQSIKIPEGFKINYEIELGVIIGKCCKNVETSRIKEYIGGYCLALDLTAVNILEKARKSGGPWAIGKGFDTACPVSKPMKPCQIENPNDIRIWLSINGCLKTTGSTSDMIFPVEALISYIAKYMTLEPYDLILTGTPGMGEIFPGEKIIAGLGKDLSMEFNV